MNSNADPSSAATIKTWQVEVGNLESSLTELEAWMKEVSQLGIPHFGETANRLYLLRERLVHQFERETECIAQLAASSATKVNQLRRQSTQETELVLAQLDDLASRLGELEPPFDSWQQAMEEVELVVNRLTQHEQTLGKGLEDLRRKPR